MTTQRHGKFWHHAAAVAAVTLGLCLPVPATAETAAVTALYECQQVVHHDVIAYKPVNGFTCSGPVGNQPGGTILSLTSGAVYECEEFRTSMVAGTMWVFGNWCEPYGS